MQRVIMAERRFYYLCESGTVHSFDELPSVCPDEFAAARRDFQALSEQLRSLLNRLAEPEHDLFFWGDSTLDVSLEEEDRTTLSGLLAEKSACRVLDVSGPAYSFLLYRRLFAHLGDGGGRVLVLPWNLRSFSEEWLPRPSYAFPQAMAALDFMSAAGECEKRAAFEDYFIATRTDALLLETLRYKESTPFFITTHPHKGVLYYCYPASAISGRLSVLRGLLRALRAKNYRVFSYLLPINYFGLKELCSAGEHAALMRNIGLLSGFLSAESNLFADFSRTVETEHFEMVEHLFHQGRALLAGKLQDALGTLPGFAGRGVGWSKCDTSLLRPILPEEMNLAARRIKLAVPD